jgi:hypothetical protein
VIFYVGKNRRADVVHAAINVSGSVLSTQESIRSLSPPSATEVFCLAGRPTVGWCRLELFVYCNSRRGCSVHRRQWQEPGKVPLDSIDLHSTRAYITEAACHLLNNLQGHSDTTSSSNMVGRTKKLEHDPEDPSLLVPETSAEASNPFQSTEDRLRSFESAMEVFMAQMLQTLPRSHTPSSESPTNLPHQSSTQPPPTTCPQPKAVHQEKTSWP